MLQSGALLFRERGVVGTAFADVLEHSGAPRGSVYHHFPGGKEQFAREVTEQAGAFIAAGIEAAPGDLHDLVDAQVDAWIAGLRASDFEAGCPVAAAALEGRNSPAARDAAGAAFSHWTDLVQARLEGEGVAPEKARRMALFVLSAVEGALMMSRAVRATDPLEAARAQVHELIDDVLADA
jgi:AcrR family transcriptional regulator